MKLTRPHLLKIHALAILPALLTVWMSAHAQQQQKPSPTPQEQARDEDVVRVKSDLVQADVTVLDSDGRFVRDLRAEQFELKVDGQPQPLSFFEFVRAGSSEELSAGARARRGSSLTGEPERAAVNSNAGRVIIFFVDDIHLSASSTVRVRKSLLRFVDEQMREGDRVLVFTATGQLGMLQQFATEKEVVRAAVNRLTYKAINKYENGEWRVPMDEFQALRIERHDGIIMDFFVAEVQKELMLVPPPDRKSVRQRAAGSVKDLSPAQSIVEQRSRNILQQAAQATHATLLTLERLVKTVAPLEGRKLLFFMSDGFLTEGSWGNSLDEMRRISDEAARSGTVIYSIEARGLVTTVPGADERTGFSLTGLSLTMRAQAVSDAQGSLTSLALMSGGRALLNSNDLNIGIGEGVRETSEYYLVAWQPAGGEGAGTRFRKIEVKVKGRPELHVRVRQGFFDSPHADEAATKKTKPEDNLLTALHSVLPQRGLPTTVAAGYVNDAAEGAVVVASIEVDADALGLVDADAKADVDVVCAVINLEGKTIVGFEHNLTVSREAVTSGARPRFTYTRQLKVAPGLYQLRVATLDRRTGRTGSALRWLEVPEMKPGKLALSSLFVGEPASAAAGKLSPQAEPRFTQGSRLGFLVYLYNAGLASGRPDLSIQVDIFRDKEAVASLPLLRLTSGEGVDATRLPFGKEVSLEGLSAGRYVLQVTASDRIGNTYTKQRTPFVIE